MVDLKFRHLAKTRDDCEHNRSRQLQKLNWIRLVEPHYWRIFATTLQYFCKNTSLFLQLPFAFLQHVPSTCSTALLWSKKRRVTNTGLNWPPLVQMIKCSWGDPTESDHWHSMRKWWFFVTYTGSQLTFMTQHEKVMIFRDLRGVTTDLLDV